MLCNNCGAEIQEGSFFCSRCGKKQSEENVNDQNEGLTSEITKPMTLGQFLAMMILGAIPLVGFILLLIWSFSDNVNLNKKNYARAALIIAVAGIVLFLIAVFVFGFSALSLNSTSDFQPIY